MKVGIIVTARLKSSRLPKKVIKHILGRPMIVHMLDRLKLAKKPGVIVISTSTNPQDYPLVEIAQQQEVQPFCGHEDDVLLRMYDAAIQYNIDTVISCTADNPFVDPIFIDKLVDFHLSQKNEFSDIAGLPLGTSSSAINRDALEKALRIKDAEDTEFWFGYFKKTDQFKIGTLEVTDSFLRRPTLRLTVDYPEDFELITKIFEGLYKEGKVFSLKEILEYLDSHSELLKINMHLKQVPALAIELKDDFRYER